MPDMNSAQKKAFDGLQESKALAPQLRASAKAAAKDMFESGDLRDYLNLLKNMHSYDAYNLILILQQFPRATCLAGFKVWQRLLSDPRAMVLKPEWRGKGIDLVAPFTDILSPNERRLVWFAVKQFDISQTNVKYSLPPSVYVQDQAHLSLLVESACNAIGNEYHRRVYHCASDPAMKASGLIGQMSEYTISIRDDASFSAQLQWLVECMSTLHGEADKLPSPCRPLLHECVKYALWNAWSLEHPPSLYAYRNKIRSISDEIQMELLDAIRRTFRALEESIAAAYVLCREEKAVKDSIKELDEDILANELRPPI